MIFDARPVLALLAGWLAATLQLAGALKTAPPLAGLPFDLSLLAFAALLPVLAVLAATARWRLDPALALPLAAALVLPLWWVVAGSWTASRDVASDKLPEIVLAGPAMLATGLLVGAEQAARRGLVAASLLIGLALASVILWRFAGGWQAALDPDAGKVHHQLAGLALAIAAGLAALRAVESRSALRAVCWLLVVGALAVAALLPGGRTALLALGLGVALAPALRLWLDGRHGACGTWLSACLAALLLFLLLLMLRPEEAEGLRTLERLSGEAAGLEARLGLWAAALDWAGRAAPFGLGAGGFTIAAGHGERRGLYPHNHALEALAEAGLPGLLLWLLAFGGGLLAAIRLLRRVAPARAARIAAMVLPVALTVMVSTDLGNRMAWFALGLALSLGVASAPAHAVAPRHV
ncbi:O-antigen polymerase [Falsiroseomonas bella]|uniref:O-antigen polymerase n=1 Tax=Falsiroseomonas bella TaxID=2184016 RepID=A0A317FJJ2_9PROT|nr:O-antigen polymerase [Falsiroseomonas bella]PWS38793.1 O-antigen polymerase [Falsiroseomonas bella]